MALTKSELEDTLDDLKEHKAGQTELITVYVPAGYDINSVQKQLEAEGSTAKNIKSTSTRKNVMEALDKIVRHLKEFKETPENGLAIFCGDVSKTEGQNDVQLWSIEPPTPLKMRLYRCDKEFVLDPLEEMLESEEIYGLIVMDRKEATIGVLDGKRIEILQTMTSGIPSKVKAGGQCLSPDTKVEIQDKGEIPLKDASVGENISSLHMDKGYDFYNKILNKWDVKKDVLYTIKLDDGNHLKCSGDHVVFIYNRENDWLRKNKTTNVDVHEVPASELQEGDYLLKNNSEKTSIKEIKTQKGEFDLIDIEVQCGEFFANRVVVHNSAQRFHRITEGLTKDFYKRIAEETKKAFFENKKLKGILVGGPIPTKDEFLDNEYLPTKLQNKVLGRIDLGGSDESGIKELVTKSQNILEKQEIMQEKNLLKEFFESLGRDPDLTYYTEEKIKKALEYGAVEKLLISKDFPREKIKEYRKEAEDKGAEVEIISNETDEGKQFKNLSGIGAILRFKIE